MPPHEQLKADSKECTWLQCFYDDKDAPVWLPRNSLTCKTHAVCITTTHHAGANVQQASSQPHTPPASYSVSSYLG